MITRGVVNFFKAASIDHTARDLIIRKLNQLTCYIPPRIHLSLPTAPPLLFSPYYLHRYPLFIPIMPSLRRTSSHPSLRSSPYGPTQRTQHPYPHRRSSGPEPPRRRVLADIDWWTVSDGQVPAATQVQTTTAAAQEQDENVHVQAPVPERTQPDPPTVEDVEESVLREDSPVVHTTISVSSPLPIVGLRAQSLFLQFNSRAAGYAALSVAPRRAPLAARRHTVPTSFYRTLGTSLSLSTDFEDHSPASSLTSSPEPSPLPLTPTTTPTFNFGFSDDCFSDVSIFPTPSTPPRLGSELPESCIDYNDDIIPCNPAFSQVLDSSFTQFINDGFLL